MARDVRLAADAAGPVVQLNDVARIYPGASRPALAVKELSIRKGEFFSVLGPSGSGKTTALRLIAGFERPEKGAVHIDGVNVTDVPAYRRDVNTVFQSYALFPHMTVQENVQYPLRMAGVATDERKRRALEALSMVEMGQFEARYPHQLSGGQRQRIALARAFVGRPKILLLDEPLSALDLNLRHQMQHLLVALQRELGLTFVYVTHDQGEALSMSNRVAVVSEGQIQQLDTPKELYCAPKNQFIARFIGKSNIMPVILTSPGHAEFLGQQFGVAKDHNPGAAILSLRFEAVTLQPQGAARMAGQLQVPGVISDVLFMGSSVEVKVSCGDQDIIAIVPFDDRVDFSSGQAVEVSFDPAKGHVFNV
jgi:spermidine/putrescine transport system ATP-binding protein